MRITRLISGRPMRRRWYRAFATFFLAFAVVLVGLYTWFVWDQATNGIETDARVVGVDHAAAGEFLTVEFTTEDGQPVTTDFREYSGDHQVDDRVRVRYVLRDPRIARQADEPVADPTVFVIGGFFLVLGTGMVVHAWGFASDPVVWPLWRRPSAGGRPH